MGRVLALVDMFVECARSYGELVSSRIGSEPYIGRFGDALGNRLMKTEGMKRTMSRAASGLVSRSSDSRPAIQPTRMGW